MRPLQIFISLAKIAAIDNGGESGYSNGSFWKEGKMEEENRPIKVFVVTGAGWAGLIRPTDGIARSADQLIRLLKAADTGQTEVAVVAMDSANDAWNYAKEIRNDFQVKIVFFNSDMLKIADKIQDNMPGVKVFVVTDNGPGRAIVLPAESFDDDLRKAILGETF